MLLLLLMLPVLGAQAAVVFTTLYSFDTLGMGPLVGPDGALVQGSDGDFYGTTEYGGVYIGPTGETYGTVFRISTNGTLTTLYSFTGGNDGAGPSGLVQGSDGYFYGTTGGGGANGDGTVFKISTNGAFTTLYSFGTIQDLDGDPLDGANPQTGMLQGNDGSFYGTTLSGGTKDVHIGGGGTIFRLTIVPEPQLTIIPSGPYVILTWPTNYTGFTLQSTTNLGSSAVWTTNSSPPVVIGGQNVAINAISGRQQFFRLSQ